LLRIARCSRLPSVTRLNPALSCSLVAALTLTLPGCVRDADAPARAMVRPSVDWRAIATTDDRRRLREWRTAWTRALAAARAAGHEAEIAREGALLDPDAAIPDAMPPAGDYDCRVIKLGGQSEGMLDYVAYPAFLCRIQVEQGLLSFAKLSGSQRHIGLLLEESDRRLVLLGTLQLGDERRALQYGRDRERDVAGMLERIGPRRWRVVFPYPHFESTLDVLELVPKEPPRIME
jgi:hypothetical protein